MDNLLYLQSMNQIRREAIKLQFDGQVAKVQPCKRIQSVLAPLSETLDNWALLNS
jgi:hypothetical protein